MSGSPAGFRRLRQSFAITTTELAQLGAKVNKTGGLLLQTPEQIKAAGEAVKQYITSTFGGTIDRRLNTFQATVVNIEDSLKRFKDDAVKYLLPVATYILKIVQELVESFEKLPAPVKEIGVTLMAFGAVVTRSEEHTS